MKIYGGKHTLINCLVKSLLLGYIQNNALSQSQFNYYCNLVWGNCGKRLFDWTQNHAACVLTYSGYDADANYLIRQRG